MAALTLEASGMEPEELLQELRSCGIGQNMEEIEVFKDEMRVYIRLAMNDPTTQNIHDVVNMLERTYHMNVRLKGNTISYAPVSYTHLYSFNMKGCCFCNQFPR